MTTSEPFDFAKYKTPQLDEEPIPRLPSPRTVESNDGEKSTGNLSDLLGQVSKNSKGEIDSLIGELQRLRRKLQTDGDRIQREIEEYHALSQQVMLVLFLAQSGHPDTAFGGKADIGRRSVNVRL
jgi:hypothetical protein